ncbi:MAG: PP2C family serine/threonine-protein phosphatase [Chloroflexota bacterium]|nr:PP2C family serine/threonine-protein phosphatase [Chloroflexota bacterium]
MQFLRDMLKPEKGSASASAESGVKVAVEPSDQPSPIAMSTQTRFRVAWATDVGKARNHNEDTALVITATYDGDDVPPAFGLFALADGMGGHQAGEVASSLAARTAAHHIVHRLYLPTLIGQEPGTAQPSLNEVLVGAVQAANSAVVSQIPGGGTTLTCAVVLGPRAYIAHVGDSRAYVITEEGMDQITQDHSLVDRLVELGQLTPDEAATHPQKNVLYRAVGQRSGTLEVETEARTIIQGGRLLLCSDGLWGMVNEAEIIRIVASAPSLQTACDNLIAAANQAGGHDNITAILVEPPQG